MSNFDPYISAIAVGTSVRELTRDTSAAASAGGYAAFIQAITGVSPTVRSLPGGRAEILLTTNQVHTLQGWLDSQVGSLLSKPETAPKVNYNLSPVFVPWAIKYLVPAGVAIFIAGWLAGWYIQR